MYVLERLEDPFDSQFQRYSARVDRALIHTSLGPLCRGFLWLPITHFGSCESGKIKRLLGDNWWGIVLEDVVIFVKIQNTDAEVERTVRRGSGIL